MNDNFTIKFWGVRGSYPAPGPDTVRYGGNTTSLEVRVGGHLIILDSGTGIIGLGKELNRRGVDKEAVLLLTHLHHDHTQGFPFFAPAFDSAFRLNIFGPDILNQSLEEALGSTMTPPNFPITIKDMHAEISIGEVGTSDVIVLGADGPHVYHSSRLPELNEDQVRIRVLHSHAHPGGILHYRIEYRGKSFVFATDREGYVHVDRRLASFAHGADLLVHDAQYTEAHYIGQMPGQPTTQGFGHSTPQMAADVAHAAEVKNLILTHHDPNYSDEMLDQIAAQAPNWFPGTVLAKEGMCLDMFNFQPDKRHTSSRRVPGGKYTGQGFASSGG